MVYHADNVERGESMQESFMKTWQPIVTYWNKIYPWEKVRGEILRYIYIVIAIFRVARPLEKNNKKPTRTVVTFRFSPEVMS